MKDFRTSELMKGAKGATIRAATFAVLIVGPAAAAADSGPPKLAEAKSIADECVAAEASLETTKAGASSIDDAYRTSLYQAQAHVAQAYRLSLLAHWPAELGATRTKINTALVLTIGDLANFEKPPARWSAARVRNGLAKDCVVLTRTAGVLQGVAPPPPPVAPPSNAPVVPPGPTADFQFTDLQPSVDSKVFYCSSSDGNDANDGLTPSTPVKSIAQGCYMLRDGMPDWLLLKRGDTWTGESFNLGSNTIHGASKSGRSEAERMVIWSYGTSTERPKLIDGYLQGNAGQQLGNLALMGLRFERPEGSTSQNNIAIYMLSYGDNILLEDLYVAGYAMNIDVCAPGGDDAHSNHNLKIRGSVIVDSHGGGMSSGVLLGDCYDCLVEGNVVDCNGWVPNSTEYKATIYNHDMYMYHTNHPMTVRNNIVARASATGMTVWGGLVEENLFLQDPLGMTAANYATIRRNVFLDSRDIDGEPRGWGIWDTGAPQGGEIYDNVLAHQVLATGQAAIEADGAANMSIHDNIVYDWLRYDDAWKTWNTPLFIQDTTSGTNQVRNNTFRMATGYLMRLANLPAAGVFTFSGNHYYSGNDASRWFRLGDEVSVTAWPSVSGETDATYADMTFTDPNRSAGSYNATFGGGATLEAFLAEARKQSRLYWRPAYTAKAVNDYIRAGFDKTIK